MDIDESMSSEDEFVLDKSIGLKMSFGDSEIEQPPNLEGYRGSVGDGSRVGVLNKAIRMRRKQLITTTDNEPTSLGDKADVCIPLGREKKPTKNKHVKKESEPKMDKSFLDMNLSRPIIKALQNMGTLVPTTIQLRSIPIALEGKDICGCAATGSGKTLAFLIPIVERLLYRPKGRLTRVLIITPTRELGMQICQVAKQLSQFMPIQINICLAIGGFDLKSQEASLRQSPDMVIATPGRLIDLLHNSPSFTLHNVEIVVLDEADRMLDEYFAEQMTEVMRLCARIRQTMLFSATMSDQVEGVVNVSLKDPIRIAVNSNQKVAPGISQEFIRIKANMESDREAVLVALLRSICPKESIVFFQTKKLCHRIHILLGLLGFKTGELHGSISQAQRVQTLHMFKNKEVDILLATDLAARGLDIVGVQTVVNFTMPNTLQHYIHRVGRTARAGNMGRSISLCGETERKILKEVVKTCENGIALRRIISLDVLAATKQKIEAVDNSVNELLELDRNEKLLDDASKKLDRAENLLNGEEKTAENVKRQWFQSKNQRQMVDRKTTLGQHSGSGKLSKRDKGKIFANGNNKVFTAADRVEKELSKTTTFRQRHGVNTVKPVKSKKSHFAQDLSTPIVKKREKKILLNRNKRVHDKLGKRFAEKQNNLRKSKKTSKKSK